ncbi:hypothetical protein B0H14DRAFT_2560326 [Mycena olivaceomarginata]|nr:hypothetical protein B0H14DRAFT_2560326 [Mycena olivaceomarginata]
MPSEICDERTASRLGRFNSTRRAFPTTLSNVPSYTITTHMVIPTTLPTPDAPEDIAAIRSAPTVMDLVNDENLDTNSPTDIAALEEMWFNAPDPYDLSEADRCPPDAPFVMRSTSRFEISGYVKWDSPGLSELILLGSSRKYGPLKGTVTEFPSTCYASFTASAVYTAIRQLKCGVFHYSTWARPRIQAESGEQKHVENTGAPRRLLRESVEHRLPNS